MLKDVIHQRGCLRRSCDLGNGCGWGIKRKSHKIKKAFTQTVMLVSLRGRSVINSTLWGQRWSLPWDVETKGKGGYVKRERGSWVERMASQDTKCHVVMPAMRPTGDGGKRQTPQYTRVNAPSVPVTQSHGGRVTCVFRIWFPGRCSQTQWGESLMAAKSPGKFLVSAHFWPLFNTSGLRSLDLDPGNVWEICLKNSKT